MPDEEMILIEKGGEQIRVHPDALADHKRIGWTVVEPQAEEQPQEAPAVPPEPEPEPKPRRGRKS